MGVIDRAPRLHTDSSQDVRSSCGGSGQLTSWEMIMVILLGCAVAAGLLFWWGQRS